MSDYIVRSNSLEREVEQKSTEDIQNPFQENNKIYQRSAVKKYGLLQDDGAQNISSECDGITYLENLEKILSTEIHLLKIARKNALKVQGSCGICQRPEDASRCKPESSNVNANYQCLSGVLTSDGNTTFDNYGFNDESNNNIPMDFSYAENSPLFFQPPAYTCGQINFVNYAVQEQTESNQMDLTTIEANMRNNLPMQPPILPSQDAPEHTQMKIEATKCLPTVHSSMMSDHGKPADETEDLTLQQAPVIRNKTQESEKELQRKATHNKVEKRRRSFINDRIFELQSLLPEKSDRVTSANKGSILKESVDYMRKLQTDISLARQLKEKVIEIDLESKQLAIRIEMLEKRIAFNVQKTYTTRNKESSSDEAIDLPYGSEMNKPRTSVISTLPQTMSFDDGLDSIVSW